MPRSKRVKVQRSSNEPHREGSIVQESLDDQIFTAMCRDWNIWQSSTPWQRYFPPPVVDPQGRTIEALPNYAPIPLYQWNRSEQGQVYRLEQLENEEGRAGLATFWHHVRMYLPVINSFYIACMKVHFTSSSLIRSQEYDALLKESSSPALREVESEPNPMSSTTSIQPKDSRSSMMGTCNSHEQRVGGHKKRKHSTDEPEVPHELSLSSLLEEATTTSTTIKPSSSITIPEEDVMKNMLYHALSYYDLPTLAELEQELEDEPETEKGTLLVSTEMKHLLVQVLALESNIESKYTTLVSKAQLVFATNEMLAAQELKRATEDMTLYCSMLCEKDVYDQQCRQDQLLHLSTTSPSCHQCFLLSSQEDLLISCESCPRVFCVSCLTKVYGLRMKARTTVKKCPCCKSKCCCEYCSQHVNVKSLREKFPQYCIPTSVATGSGGSGTTSRETIMKVQYKTKLKEDLCRICLCSCSTPEHSAAEPPSWLRLPLLKEKLRQSLSDSSTPPNDHHQNHPLTVIQCQKCQLRVHSKCLLDINDPQLQLQESTYYYWICSTCKVLASSLVNVLTTRLHLSTGPNITCRLCPQKMKLCDNQLLWLHSPDESFPSNPWVHAYCLSWHALATEFESFHSTHTHGCTVPHCPKPQAGVTIFCSYDHCAQSIHPLCAALSPTTKTPVMMSKIPVVFCLDHQPPENNLQSYAKLKSMRYDLERVRMLCTLIHKRELVLKKIQLLNAQLYARQMLHPVKHREVVPTELEPMPILIPKKRGRGRPRKVQVVIPPPLRKS